MAQQMQLQSNDMAQTVGSNQRLSNTNSSNNSVSGSNISVGINGSNNNNNNTNVTGNNNNNQNNNNNTNIITATTGQVSTATAAHQNNNHVMSASAPCYTPLPAGAVSGTAIPVPMTLHTTAGQHNYTQALQPSNLYMTAQSVPQHAPLYQAVFPTSHIPNNLYVNNVTANVNLHGWPHTVPFLSAANAQHYVHGDIPQDQPTQVLQQLPALPVALGPAITTVSNSTATGIVAMRGGARRGRGRGHGRRGEYTNSRHPPPSESPNALILSSHHAEQMLQHPTLVHQPAPHLLTQQQLDGQLMVAAPAAYATQQHFQHGPQYQYAIPAYYNVPSAAAAQQAAGQSVYLQPMSIYNPQQMHYMGGYMYPGNVMNPEYHYLPADDAQIEDRSNAEGMIPQMWHSSQLYADEYAASCSQQISNADDLNHNSSSLCSSETLSPNYPMYETQQVLDVQQSMNMMQIYDEERQVGQLPNENVTTDRPLEDLSNECATQTDNYQNLPNSNVPASVTLIAVTYEEQLVTAESQKPVVPFAPHIVEDAELTTTATSTANVTVTATPGKILETAEVSEPPATVDSHTQSVGADKINQIHTKTSGNSGSKVENIKSVNNKNVSGVASAASKSLDAKKTFHSPKNIENIVEFVPRHAQLKQQPPQQPKQQQKQQQKPQQQKLVSKTVEAHLQSVGDKQKSKGSVGTDVNRSNCINENVPKSNHVGLTAAVQQELPLQKQASAQQTQQLLPQKQQQQQQHNNHDQPQPMQSAQQQQAMNSHEPPMRKKSVSYNSNQATRRKYNNDGNSSQQQQQQQIAKQQSAYATVNGNSSSNDVAHVHASTKTMSWTNSSKNRKSTASVACTAVPNSNYTGRKSSSSNSCNSVGSNTSNNHGTGKHSSSSSYTHPTKTYTNQQHYANQQNNYAYSQSQQTRGYGGMKVPSSPTAVKSSSSQATVTAAAATTSISTANTVTAAITTTTSATSATSATMTSSRKNSQVEPPFKSNASSNNLAATTAGNTKSNNVGNTITTSTAAITAAPNQCPPQHSQKETAAVVTAVAATTATTATFDDNTNSALNKQYPGFALPANKKPISHTAPAVSAMVSTDSKTQPPVLNLAPPLPPASTTVPSNTPSWASLFDKSSKSKRSSTNSAGLAAAALPAAAIVACNSNSNNASLNSFGNSTNAIGSSPNALLANKPVAKVAPFEPDTPAATAMPPPLILPAGGMSYSVASALGISSSATSATSSAAAMSSNANNKQITNSAIDKRSRSSSRNKNNNNNNVVNNTADDWSLKFADFLVKYKTDLTPISLRPRGLTNRSNYCYINSILQALLGCPPFYNLIRSIPRQYATSSEVKTPTVNAMISLISNYSTLPFGLRLRSIKKLKGKKDFGCDLQCDSSIEPSDLYKLWNESRDKYSEGRQEDAEEFLGYMLNKLNDEMLEIIQLVAKPKDAQQNGQSVAADNENDDDDGDVWQMIYNNRNKGSITRQADYGQTPLSDIFRGELRSRLQREGEHFTDIIQPFFTLQLNIEKVASVKDALELLVGRNQLEGVTGSKTKQEVLAWQQMNLEKLPIVLILHLKYFDYRPEGCTKILKKVDFPIELKIDTKILASKKYSQRQRAYRLFAVVYHDGKEATKGHYITDVFHAGYGSWLRYDDNTVKPVCENYVLLPQMPRVPYLLYYRRCDTLPMVNTANTAGGVGTAAATAFTMQHGVANRERDIK